MAAMGNLNSFVRRARKSRSTPCEKMEADVVSGFTQESKTRTK